LSFVESNLHHYEEDRMENVARDLLSEGFGRFSHLSIFRHYIWFLRQNYSLSGANGWPVILGLSVSSNISIIELKSQF